MDKRFKKTDESFTENQIFDTKTGKQLLAHEVMNLLNEQENLIESLKEYHDIIPSLNGLPSLIGAELAMIYVRADSRLKRSK
jgi:hypothetical protein